MEYTKEDEFQLIKDILAGRQEKFKILVDRYASMVFHVVRRFVNVEEDVEELAQQIFVKTYEKLNTFSENSRFSSWLYMIAINHCRDYAKNVRRENRSFSEMEEHDLEAILGQGPQPDQVLEGKEWQQLLHEGLIRINDDYAEAFLMKYQDGMTYKTMSQRLDASVSALKVRVHRAKKELKEFIEQNI